MLRNQASNGGISVSSLAVEGEDHYSCAKEVPELARSQGQPLADWLAHQHARGSGASRIELPGFRQWCVHQICFELNAIIIIQATRNSNGTNCTISE